MGRLDASCQFVIGRRGSGKSTRVKELVKAERPARVVVFDPTGEYAREKGFTTIDTPADLRRALKGKARKGFKIAYAPDGDWIKALHDLASEVWRVMAPFEAGAIDWHILLIVEEANLGYPAERLPRDRGGFERLILQGRHRGVSIIAVTQRPALVHANFRSNAPLWWVFALEDQTDLDVIRRKTGERDIGAQLRQIDPHHYLKIEAGAVEPGRNTTRFRR